MKNRPKSSNKHGIAPGEKEEEDHNYYGNILWNIV